MSGVVDDDLWRALGDPTRCRVLDLLLDARASTATTLSDHLPVSRQAVAKHLEVLERAGLVSATLEGRERRYRLDDAQLSRALRQLRDVGAAWDARLSRITQIAEGLEALASRGAPEEPRGEREGTESDSGTRH